MSKVNLGNIIKDVRKLFRPKIYIDDSSGKWTGLGQSKQK